jgi:hypothetical protein
MMHACSARLLSSHMSHSQIHFMNNYYSQVTNITKNTFRGGISYSNFQSDTSAALQEGKPNHHHEVH